MIESGLRFDFTAIQNEKLDQLIRFWPCVDFRLHEATGEIWLEVKNWEQASLPARNRGGQRRSFLAKVGGKELYRELREKFLGTCSFLALSGQSKAGSISYVILLESPKFDAALKLHANQRMRQQIRPNHPWAHGVDVAVLDLAEWNARFPSYPASPD